MVPVNNLGDGWGVACIGQSNEARKFGSSPPSPGESANANTRRWSGSAWGSFGTNQDGAKVFANRLQTALAVPIGLYDNALGGSSVVPGASDDNWQKGQPLYDDLVSDAAAIGGCDCFLWTQGEVESTDSTYYLEYAKYLSQMITDLRNDITNTSGLPEIPFVISSVCRLNDSDRQHGVQYVREQQYAVAEQMPGVYIGAAGHDQANTDDLHIDDYTTISERCAVAVIDILGGSPAHATYLAPHITGLSVVSATQTDISIDLVGATDFTPTTGIEGFKVFQNGGAELAISAAVRQSATVIRLTHASVTGDRTVTHAYGADANITAGLNPTELSSMVRDNSTVPRALLALGGLTTATIGGGSSDITAIARGVTRAIAV